MEHLSLPHNNLGHITVPDLGGPDFDGEDFPSFPERCGWDIQAFRRGETTEEKLRLSPNQTPTCRIDQCVQTWLFFGTMSIAFRRRVNRNQYSRKVDDGSDSRVLTGESWLRDLAPLNQRSTLNHDDKQNKLLLQEALDLAALVLLDITRRKSSVLHVEVHIHLAVHVYLLHYLAKLAHLPPGSTGSVFASSPHMFDFKTTLIDKGWCPSLLERLAGTGCPGMYYCTRMVESPDHSSGRSHTACSESACVALNIDEATYQPRHVDVNCTCQMHKIPTSELVDIVKANEVPVIEINESLPENHNPPKSSIKPASKVSNYVAISHVWSDGLGNVNGNAMPTCQLLRISRLVEEVSGVRKEPVSDNQPSKAFWMDTLCVPVSADSKKWRIQAIRSMASVYRDARAVLVLDQTMTSIPAKDQDTEETLMRINSCNWMTRLWTLQEGALADNLFFQFEDKAVDFAYLKYRIERANAPTAAQLLISRALASHRDVFNLRKTIKQYQYPLAAVWNSLRGRTTSHGRDEPVCIGTLMGLDVAPLLQSEDIMEEFWKMQRDNIPSSILWTGAERMMSDGFKWAPASLLQPNSIASRLRDECTRATWNPVFGLTVTGIMSHVIKYPWTPSRKNSTTSEYHLNFEYVVPETKQRLKVFLAHVPGNGPWSKLDLHLIKDPVILLEMPITPTNQVNGVIAAPMSSPVSGKPTRLSWRAAVDVREAGGHFDRVAGYAGVAASFRGYSNAVRKVVVDENGNVRDAEGTCVEENHVWTIR